MLLQHSLVHVLRVAVEVDPAVHSAVHPDKAHLVSLELHIRDNAGSVPLSEHLVSDTRLRWGEDVPFDLLPNRLRLGRLRLPASLDRALDNLSRIALRAGSLG